MKELGQLRKTEAKKYKPKIKIKKKVVPTRKWKDGKEVKRPSQAQAMLEYVTEFSGAPSRKILKKK